MLAALSITMAQFVQACIAAGCDYLKNVCGVGINKAFAFVRSGQILHELKKKGCPDLSSLVCKCRSSVSAPNYF